MVKVTPVLTIADTVKGLRDIRKFASTVLIEKFPEVDLVSFVFMTGRAGGLVGEGGAAKSLTESLMASGTNARRCGIQLHPNLKPQDLMGVRLLPALAQGREEWDISGRMLDCDIVHFKELGAANPATIVGLSDPMNEGEARLGGQVYDMRHVTWLFDMNAIPDADPNFAKDPVELTMNAVLTRILFLRRVEAWPKSWDNRLKMLSLPSDKLKDRWQYPGAPITQAGLMQVREWIWSRAEKLVDDAPAVAKRLIRFVDALVKQGIRINPRMMMWWREAIYAAALLDGRETPTLTDLGKVASLCGYRGRPGEWEKLMDTTADLLPSPMPKLWKEEQAARAAYDEMMKFEDKDATAKMEASNACSSKLSAAIKAVDKLQMDYPESFDEIEAVKGQFKQYNRKLNEFGGMDPKLLGTDW